MDLKQYIRTIPDFPKPGILFRDITPLLQDGALFESVIDQLSEAVSRYEFDVVVGPEARGFLVGAPLANRLGKGFVPVRKPGKLPADTYSVTYSLEYGEDALEMHKDAIKPGQRVLVIDDLLATGGTIFSAIDLVRKAGGTVAAAAFIVELPELKGRQKLHEFPVISLVQYEGA
jgi:adenine phosphoribosyltransferase